MAELSSQPFSITALYSLFSEEKLYVNRRYQRKLVWTLTEKQKLIESILNKYPIPAILLAEKDDTPGAYEIIDGLQRLHAIVSFIETSYPTHDGRYFDITQFQTARRRADEGAFSPTESTSLLKPKEISSILDYILAISVMRNATVAEINDVFGRINTYGHRLSDQERRQAGVQNALSSMVRELACTLRGDASDDVLLLAQMPTISIDLPMAKHGYDVQADEVFWVKQGILRSTDLRDSLDEQCIADIAACIIQGSPIERSKEALDLLYVDGSPESKQLLNALDIYGANTFADEFKYCVDEIIKVSNEGGEKKLRDIIFKHKNTNAFPSVFAVILFAFHELIVKEKKKVADYAGVKDAITNLSARIEQGRKTTSPEERRKNIDTVKGLIGKYFVEAKPAAKIYGNHTTTDIDAVIRRTEIEVGNYELKQGVLSLGDQRGIDNNIYDKVVQTICAVANTGPDSSGQIIIGVADKIADANRIAALDKITPLKIGKRYVVGVNREAVVLKESVEAYFARWKDAISKSQLTPALKKAVLGHIDYNNYHGLGVIVISIPAQKAVSFVGDDLFIRSGSSTEKVTTAKGATDDAARFAR